MILKLFLIILLLPSLTLAEVYFRPVPTMPVLDKPLSEISDIVTYSLVTQIHKGLFTNKENSIYTTSLVKSFEVKNKGKLYIIYLVDGLKFSDGSVMTAMDVKRSLKKSLIGAKGHLLKKFGLGSILRKVPVKNRSSKWIGFEAVNDYQLRIRLSHANPKLVYYLADPRMSIVKGKGLKNGLGDYKISKLNDTQIELRARNSDKEKKFNIINYFKLDQVKAVEQLKKGKVHDLSLYNLSEKQLNTLNGLVKVESTHFPRTFSFFINPKRIKLKNRKVIAKYLSKANILAQCKILGKKNNSLIPRGFPGSTEVPISNVKVNNKISINLLVPKGAGNEGCIKKSVEKLSDSYVKFNVKVTEFSNVVKKWHSNKADAFFGYIEGESDFSFFEHFLDTSTFLLGQSSDAVVNAKYNKILEATSLSDQYKLSKGLSKYLDKKYYYLPVYSPVVRSAYKSGMSFSESSLQAPYQLEIARIK